MLEAVHRGFADVFDVLSGYNLNAKKFRRIYAAIIVSLVLDLLIGALCSAIFAGFAQSITDFLFPDYVDGLYSAEYQVSNVKDAVVYEALSSICMFWPL